MRLTVPFLLLLALLAGCAPGPQVVRPSAEDTLAAELAMRQCDYLVAIELFNQLADKAEVPKRNDYRLRVAQAQIGAGLLEEARTTLDGLTQASLTAQQTNAYTLLDADLLLANHPALALEKLEDIHLAVTSSDDYDLKERFQALLARAYSGTDRHWQAAHAWLERELYLLEPARIPDNQRKIWNALAQVSDTQLGQLQLNPTETISGWIQLSLATRDLSDGSEAIVERINRWRMQNPTHPADPRFLDQLTRDYQALGKLPQQVALLLPLSGQYAKAGHAILGGILAAYYLNPLHAGVTLRIYDTAIDPNQVAQVYQQALGDGAQLVIGPLQKETAQILAQLEDLSIPVVALNQTEDPLSTNLYQFSLSPEGEARQVAKRAWLDGHKRAALLMPEGQLGERMGQAFIRQWLELGGEAVSIARYDLQKNDFSQPIKSLLNLNDSENRHRQIVSLLGQQFEFIPRRRQDIDFIFIGGFPRQARLIRPQLKFHHAGNLPLYATSQVYSGSIDQNHDRDMDGIIFCDMPWTLGTSSHLAATRKENLNQLARHGEQLQRLVALGIDAVQLAPLIDHMARYPGSYYRGESGGLSLNEQRQVERKLDFAVFVNGKPRRLEAPAPDALEQH